MHGFRMPDETINDLFEPLRRGHPLDERSDRAKAISVMSKRANEQITGTDAVDAAPITGLAGDDLTMLLVESGRSRKSDARVLWSITCITCL